MPDETPPPPTDAPAGGKVRVVSPWGEHGEADSSALDSLVTQGFRPETEQEQAAAAEDAKFGNRPIAAGAAGLARGLTLGFSDPLLTSTGLVAPETLKGLKEHNAGASAVGDVAGTALGLLDGVGEASLVRGVATLGEGAGELAARAVGQGALGTAAKIATRGAVEGTLYGVGNAVSDEALGDPQAVGQKLLASVGMGSLLAVGGSFLGEALGAAARPVAKAAAKALDNLPDQLGEAAEIRALKASGAIQKDLNKLDEGQGNKIGRDLLDAGVFDGASSKADVFERVKSLRAREGQHIGNLLDRADQQTGGRSFDLQAVVDRARKEILAPIAGDPALKSEAAKLSGMLDDYEAQAGAGIDFAEANRFKSNLQSKINKFVDTPTAQKYTKQLSGLFNDEIESQIDQKVSPQLAEEFIKSKGRYGSFKSAVKYAKAGVDREAGNRFISLSDYGVGGAAGLLAGGPVGVAASAAGAIANKVARERGPAFSANLLDSFAKSPVFNKLAQGFQSFAQTTLQQSPRVFGQYSGILANAAARGADDLLLTHAALSERDPNYRATMQAAGLDYSEDPRQVAQRAQTLAVLGHHIDGFGADLDASLGGALEGEKAKAAFDRLSSKGEQILSGFDQQAKAVRELTEDPNALADRLAQAIGPLADHAPNVAAAMSTTASNAVAFLNSKLPKSTDPLQEVPALQRPYSPSDAEKARFERYVAAVSNPTAALEQLRRGEVTKESIEALQAVYPAFYAELQQRAMDRLASVPGQLDYRKRVALSRLLGQPLDASMRPQRLLAAQAAHAVAPKGPAPHPSRAAQKALPGATLSQQIEGRGV